MELSFCLCTDRQQVAFIPLELVRVGGTVECVGSVGFLREAKLPVNAQLVIVEVTLIEKLPLFPIAVCGSSVASASSSADAVVNASDAKSQSGIGFYGAEATALNANFNRLAFIMSGNNVDGSAKALSAVNTTGSAFENLDAFNVTNVYGKVCCKMSCLGVADVDTV